MIDSFLCALSLISLLSELSYLRDLVCRHSEFHRALQEVCPACVL